MGFVVEDGTGKGYRVKVTEENQLKTVGELHELQHHTSVVHGQVYQVIGDYTVVGAGTFPILHVQNTSATRDAVVSYMRLQYPGGDGTIDAATYFSINFNQTYSSGGTEVTAVNMNRNSGNVAELTCYDNNPTLAGTATEFDRWYCDKDMMTFNKHGSLVLGTNDAMSIKLTTDQVAGLAYCRITIMLRDKV